MGVSDAGESDRLIAHADGVWRRMISVALNTGLRRGELLGIRQADDVDDANGVLHVVENYVRGQFKAPKSGKPRDVPLNARASQALAENRHTRGDRAFCDDEGRPFTQGVMASQLERVCRLAGLRTIGWHVLRHSFASALVMRGVPLKAVQELLGHTSIRITERYAHLAPHVTRDAVRLLDAPSERPAPTEPMPKAPASVPAHAGGIVQGPTSERPREKSRRTPRTRPAAERVVAKNWQETRPVPPPV